VLRELMYQCKLSLFGSTVVSLFVIWISVLLSVFDLSH